MSGSEFKRGDRVRVVLEGEIGTVGRTGSFLLGRRAENHIDPNYEHVVSVEKLEPPVEVFKPGDVVRSKGGYDLWFITRGGYAYANGPNAGAHFEDGGEPFTSQLYEKVDIG